MAKFVKTPESQEIFLISSSVGFFTSLKSAQEAFFKEFEVPNANEWQWVTSGDKAFLVSIVIGVGEVKANIFRNGKVFIQRLQPAK